MKDAPFLFSAESVRAILAGTKTETRRPMKPQPAPAFLARGLCMATPQWPYQNGIRFFMADGLSELVSIHKAQPGQKIWVKETFKLAVNERVVYRADEPTGSLASRVDRAFGPWKPSIFMPRWASRLTLRCTGVRAERLQEINYAGVVAEGTPGFDPNCTEAAARSFYFAWWDRIHGKGSAAENPWVFVYTFKRLK
jgi:hypothetical protein